MTTREDRIAGVVAGQAVGDALGAPSEFGPKGSAPKLARGVMGHPAGSWTDDSEQLTCVLKARSDALLLAAGLLAWYNGHPRDVGNQTASVLSRANTPGDVLAAAAAYAARAASAPKPASWSPGSGNGSLMRTSAVCLPYLGDRERIAEAARQCSEVTHASPWDGDACVIWSLAVDAAIADGASAIAELVSGGLDLIPAERRGYWADAIREALSSHPSRFNPNGGCVAAFKCALSANANYSFAGVISAAIAAGHDTDTTAAIAGGLAGARFGASSIPAKWRDRVFGWSPEGEISCAELEELALQVAGVPAR